MSRQNVEIVRALATAFQRREHARVFELYHPAIEWDASRMTELIPDAAGVYRGHEGVRAYWRTWLAGWKDLQFDIQGIRDAGDEVVLLISDQHQWGRHSGIATEFPAAAMVFEIHRGSVVRCRLYPDQRSALEAVGLAE